jgi:ankyrin repeat protein
MWTGVTGHAESAQSLIQGGADVRIKDEMGRTALAYAKERGHTEVVEMLKKAEKGVKK